MNGVDVWRVQENQWEDRLTPAARASGENSGTVVENSQSETGYLKDTFKIHDEIETETELFFRIVIYIHLSVKDQQKEEMEGK